jgi:hypothetical protein
MKGKRKAFPGEPAVRWKYQRIVVAYHEAGHAVMALQHGFHLSEVRHSSRRKYCDSFWDRARRYSIADVILLNLAGAAAEYVFLQKKRKALFPALLQKRLMDLQTDDMKLWNKLAEHTYTKTEIPRVRARFEQKAIEAMSDPETWAWVEGVAQALLEKQRLNEEEVLSIRQQVCGQRRKRRD